MTNTPKDGGPRRNNVYEIKVESPLLRPGMTITTWVSERYVQETVAKLMDTVRSINAPLAERNNQ